jgi:4-hydroxy-3-methylbut-2-enyl diphosphate reductase
MKLHLANPRGFCAGVERALDIVDLALKKYGLPLYVRHEIIHNRPAIESLKKRGVVFVEEIDKIPDGSRVVLSAHGSAKSVVAEMLAKGMHVIDAECPLVTNVHKAIHSLEKSGATIILIGHANHPEVLGTMGQVECDVILVENIEDVEKVKVRNPDNVGIVTQTTLNFENTQDIIDKLKERFPNIILPNKSNICYATQNRQNAVGKMLSKIDILVVVGSKNSSNSTRLKSMGDNCAKGSYLVDSPDQLSRQWFEGAKSIGMSAGASAPEWLFQSIVQWMRDNLTIEEEIEESGDVEEVKFVLPRELRK